MQRYDRQERLWSKSGQANLKNGHIWAIGKSIAMMETLKNLALAGVGNLSLSMDQASLNTFFDFDNDPIEQQLLRMNPGMTVSYTQEPDSIVDLILITAQCLNDRKSDLDKVPNVPVLIIGSKLMKGAVSLNMHGVTSVPIIEPHPSSGLADIRFKADEIWPEYKEYCDSFDMESIDEVGHRHIPFCVLLVKAQELSGTNNSSDVKHELLKLQKYPEEENFTEAARHIWRMKLPSVPQGIYDLIEMANSQDILKEQRSQSFWTLVRALGKFIDAHHCLPVSGIILDMVSRTSEYTSLKQIYRIKAEKDMEEMIGLAEKPVPEHYAKRFCENSRFIRALITKSAENKAENLTLAEFEDSKAQEIPSVAAFVGGIAAQEAMKLMMGQYTPINGTMTYDGNTQSTTIEPGNMQLIN